MADFSLSRTIVIQAEPARVHDLVDDFREWQRWSPWEGLDTDLQREYAGPARGVGSTYRWSGNAKAGKGEMRISQSIPSRVVVDVDFVKPIRTSNVTTLDLSPSGEATEVTWTMSGRRNVVMALAGRLFFDKAVGADIERGLATLKTEAERG